MSNIRVENEYELNTTSFKISDMVQEVQIQMQTKMWDAIHRLRSFYIEMCETTNVDAHTKLLVISWNIKEINAKSVKVDFDYEINDIERNEILLPVAFKIQMKINGGNDEPIELC